jgi:hypothetical protein
MDNFNAIIDNNGGGVSLALRLNSPMNPLLATVGKLRLDFESAGMLLTPEEFDAVDDYDDEYRYELIRGVLVVNPIPSEGEVDPNEELGRWLRNYQEQHPQGAALDATLPERYVRTATSRRRADRVIWAGMGRLPDSKRDAPQIGAGARRVITVAEKEVYRTNLLPGFELPLARLLAIADRWTKRR